MRSIRRTLKRQSVLAKTQRKRGVLLRTRFRTLSRSEIHNNLKIDADALNRRRRRFSVRRTVYHIYQDSEGCMLVGANASTVYVV
jgi:hypothetical protein